MSNKSVANRHIYIGMIVLSSATVELKMVTLKKTKKANRKKHLAEVPRSLLVMLQKKKQNKKKAAREAEHSRSKRKLSRKLN